MIPSPCRDMKLPLRVEEFFCLRKRRTPLPPYAPWHSCWRSHAPQERRDPAVSRGDYMERLAKDLKEYYGYLRELLDMFLAVSTGAV